MNIDEIEKHLLNDYDDIVMIHTWGEKSFFHNPSLKLKRGSYFATIKEKDGENDTASSLNREGVYRLNIGVTKDMYLSLFGGLPQRPLQGKTIEGDFDFQALNVVMPHPVYAWMGWVCILNPQSEMKKECHRLLRNSYKRALTSSLKKLL